MSDLTKNYQSYTLDDVDRYLINIMQSAFPLKVRPYKEIARVTGLPENEVLRRVNNLCSMKIINFIGAVIDTRAIGFKSLLAAFRVKDDMIDEAAGIINSHPGVSHNYLRDACYNVWVTIAVPPGTDLHGTVKKIAGMTKTDEYLELPALKTFKINLNLDAGKNTGAAIERCEYRERNSRCDGGITGADKKLLRYIQEPLPVVSNPFASIAASLGTSEENVVDAVRALIDRGIVKRAGAIASHRKIGYTHNILTLWEIPEDELESSGQFLASFRDVSHCYSRTTYSSWKYSLYAMIHSQSAGKASSIIETVRERLHNPPHLALQSMKEFKKQRLVYFTEAFENWDREHSV